MVVDEQRIVDAVELDRLADGRVDDFGLAQHGRLVAADVVEPVERPDGGVGLLARRDATRSAAGEAEIRDQVFQIGRPSAKIGRHQRLPGQRDLLQLAFHERAQVAAHVAEVDGVFILVEMDPADALAPCDRSPTTER